MRVSRGRRVISGVNRTQEVGGSNPPTPSPEVPAPRIFAGLFGVLAGAEGEDVGGLWVDTALEHVKVGGADGVEAVAVGYL